MIKKEKNKFLETWQIMDSTGVHTIKQFTDKIVCDCGQKDYCEHIDTLLTLRFITYKVA